MKLDVKMKDYTDRPGSLLGVANITFDERFGLNNVKLYRTEVDGRNGLTIVLPEYTKNNVIKQVFHPLTTEAADRINIAVLTAYKNMRNGEDTTTVDYPTVNFDLNSIYTNVYTKGNIIGLASLRFGNDYSLEGIKILEGKNGTYLSMPQQGYTVKDHGHPVLQEDGKELKKYYDVFYTASRESHNDLYKAVMKSFDVQQQMYANAPDIYLTDIDTIKKMPNFLDDKADVNDILSGEIGGNVNFDAQRNCFSMTSAYYKAVKATVAKENTEYLAKKDISTKEKISKNIAKIKANDAARNVPEREIASKNVQEH